jgi:uncharacterized delta-60 repeat protein
VINRFTAPRIAQPILWAISLLIATVALASSARADPGDLDESFFKYGKSSKTDAVHALAVQPDDKTLLLGDYQLFRLEPNGALDKPFGAGKDDGAAELNFPDSYSGTSPSDVLLQPDGRILVPTYINTAERTASFAISRLDTEGELDPSFGSGGVATVPLQGTGSLSDRGPQLALMADGRIVIAGEFGTGPQLARLLPDGQPDPSLGGDGLVEVDLGPSAVFDDVAVGPHGAIVLGGGTGGPGPGADFAVARLLPEGSPDPAFSGDGVQTTDFGERDEANAVAIQGDGMIVAAGTTSPSCQSCYDRFAVARYRTDGELDPGFGTAGRVITKAPKGIDASASEMVLQSDGKIVVGGGGGDLFLARYNPDGSADASFGDRGRTWTPFLGTYPAYGLSMALGPDGRIVAGGLVYVEEFYDFGVIARYEVADGRADLDADRVGDAKDRCPRTAGSHPSGCPVIKRTLKLKLERRMGLRVRMRVTQTSGEPLAGYRQATALLCAGPAGGKVSLYERRRGADLKVASARSASDLEVDKLGRGTYYARVGKRLLTAFKPDGPVELCRAAKSAPVVVR